SQCLLICLWGGWRIGLVFWCRCASLGYKMAYVLSSLLKPKSCFGCRVIDGVGCGAKSGSW
ncbi:hypothetical protein U1Q18_047669, partial [Sarracenia purpurea var. burkii]